MLQKLKLDTFSFVLYKFFNSLFLGVSIGSVFTIYDSLDPSLFSAGGIFLAIATLIIANFYNKILNEMVTGFLVFSYNIYTSLSIYIGYQLTFIFGSYLVRAETLVIRNEKVLTKVDSAKQFGYLLGMVISYFFYKTMENFPLFYDNKIKVYQIHFPLLVIELLVIFFLIRSFKKV
jgi:putative membrane protein